MEIESFTPGARNGPIELFLGSSNNKKHHRSISRGELRLKQRRLGCEVIRIRPIWVSN
jgi:hypothetical protein